MKSPRRKLNVSPFPEASTVHVRSCLVGEQLTKRIEATLHHGKLLQFRNVQNERYGQLSSGGV